MLSSIVSLFRNLGILFGYIAGATVQYQNIPYIFVLIPIVFAVLFTYLPNTPQFYLRTNQLQVRLHIYK